MADSTGLHQQQECIYEYGSEPLSFRLPTVVVCQDGYHDSAELGEELCLIDSAGSLGAVPLRMGLRDAAKYIQSDWGFSSLDEIIGRTGIVGAHALLNRMSWGNLFRSNLRPFLGIQREPSIDWDICSSPMLASTVVPVCGNFGSSLKPHGLGSTFTLLRERRGETFPGALSFPGGRAETLLELTGWRELNEELGSLFARLSEGRMWDWRYVGSPVRRVEFLMAANQRLLGSDGQTYHFLNLVFLYWLGFPYSGGGSHAYHGTVEEMLPMIGTEGDEDGSWQPVLLTRDGEMVLSLREGTSPITGSILPVLRRRLSMPM